MRSWTIAFLLGSCLLYSLARLPPLWLPWLLALPLLPGLFWLHLSSRLPGLARPTSLLLAILCGFGWSLWYADDLLGQQLPSALEGEDIVLQGRVVSIPVGRGQHLAFDLVVERLDDPQLQRLLERGEFPARIRLNWYEPFPALVAGERWQLQVRLKRPHGMNNPGGGDYEGRLFAVGVRARGYVRRHEANRRIGPAAGLDRMRQQLRDRLFAELEGEPLAGLLVALAVGERSGISQQQWRVFTATGTNHLMAISGLHIGLVAGLVYWLVLRLWARIPALVLRLAAPRAAAVAALCAAAGYAALAGFAIPTQRALVMVSVAMGALLLDRTVQPSRLLALALLIVLLIDPLAVHSAGFWLSFAAVAIIVYGSSGRLSATSGTRRALLGLVHVQLLVVIGLSPLLLGLFSTVSLSAPLANLLAVPWMSLVVVPLTLLAVLLMLLGLPGSGPLLALAATATEWLWQLLEVLAGWWPNPPWSVPGWVLLFAIPAVLWLLAPRGWPLRWLGLLCLLPLLTWRAPIPAHGEAWFTLLDVGQGLAAVVRTREHTLVFDTGPRYPSGFNTGDAVLLPFLRHVGVSRVDRLIVSHGDNDHIGGAEALMQGIVVGEVLSSVPEAFEGGLARPCLTGEQWLWDGVSFAILHPPDLSGDRENDASCVLRIEAGGQVLLLTGDIEVAAETQLLREHGGELRADVMVAPHHGSRTSSSAAFVRAVAPVVVFYPVGYRNRWDFPRPEVLARYLAAGARGYDTASYGALTVRLGQREGLVVESWRQQHERYWQGR